MTNAWRPVTPAPLAPRYGHTAIWTGDEMIVWGGLAATGVYCNDGARYHPGRDSWTLISRQDAPAPRWLHAAAWTGHEMAVWSGAGDDAVATGGLYDPAADRWRPIAPFTADDQELGRDSAGMVWIGTALLAWGGMMAGDDVGRGGTYDPEVGSWRPISERDQPAPRHNHASIWTGDRLLVWGGFANSKATGDNSGGCYDPATDRWTAITSEGCAKPRTNFAAVWTGDQMIVWGGYKGGKTYPGDGGSYDPQADRWTAIKRSKQAPGARANPAAVWTGREMIVWGGAGATGGVGDGGRYDPAAATWIALPGEDAPAPRSLHTGVWTGNEMIVWGGQLRHDHLFGDGAIYTP